MFGEDEKNYKIPCGVLDIPHIIFYSDCFENVLLVYLYINNTFNLPNILNLVYGLFVKTLYRLIVRIVLVTTRHYSNSRNAGNTWCYVNA